MFLFICISYFLNRVLGRPNDILSALFSTKRLNYSLYIIVTEIGKPYCMKYISTLMNISSCQYCKQTTIRDNNSYQGNEAYLCQRDALRNILSRFREAYRFLKFCPHYESVAIQESIVLTKQISSLENVLWMDMYLAQHFISLNNIKLVGYRVATFGIKIVYFKIHDNLQLLLFMGLPDNHCTRNSSLESFNLQSLTFSRSFKHTR